MGIPEYYGNMVFNDREMRSRLPEDIYSSLQKTIDSGKEMSSEVAAVVASALKDWAIEKGATHYTHWFQPMTGITAEKHDSFVSPVKGGSAIMDFSVKELIKGEPDASSFPSGGLRATFEARGYTAWDPTSYAFVKDATLYIPTVFCSYSGEVLDKKTPLLRSVQDVSEQSVRLVKMFGKNDCKKVVVTVGPEQEYFLIDKKLYEKRPDLIFCGRTIVGAKAPKGQEMDDHYYGAIRPKISAFMRELDEALWLFGIPAKTKHNEAAPSQHELAPVYEDVNTAADHNQLTMEVMKNLAEKHGLVCLLHEKPFKCVNGSGKHNNWSLSTENGENLFDPGKTPENNARFLLFLSAVIKGVDEYQDIIRMSVSSAGNDLRLGANEAPPAIVSIFLGDELTAILDAIENGITYDGQKKEQFEVGVHALPTFPKDTTDRNRTSPFAFTGNKFEFRMLGSALSIADPNTVINTVMAEELKGFADELEPYAGTDKFNDVLDDIIKRTIRNHKRIIFNGDGYSDEWRAEAEKRGLSNFSNSVEAIPTFVTDKSIKLFTEHKIFTKSEMYSRYEIMLDTYSKTINIEARTMVEMIRRDVLPVVSDRIGELCKTLDVKKAYDDNIRDSYEYFVIKLLTRIENAMCKNVEELENQRTAAKTTKDSFERAYNFRNKVIPLMNTIRDDCDDAEKYVSRKKWPYPSYGELLFSI